MHMNTLECSFVVHHQLQSHSTDQNEYSATSCCLYVTYVCAEPMAVRPYVLLVGMRMFSIPIDMHIAH